MLDIGFCFFLCVFMFIDLDSILTISAHKYAKKKNLSNIQPWVSHLLFVMMIIANMLLNFIDFWLKNSRVSHRFSLYPGWHCPLFVCSFWTREKSMNEAWVGSRNQRKLFGKCACLKGLVARKRSFFITSLTVKQANSFSLLKVTRLESFQQPRNAG